MPATITNMGTRELWEQFQQRPLDIYREAAQRMAAQGIEEAPTVSRALEFLSPTDPADRSGLDTFDRLMREAGIRTTSNRRAGFYASKVKEFDRNPGTRLLFTEYFARRWRAVTDPDLTPEQRAVLLSSDGTPGSWQRPYVEGMAKWDQQIRPAIPLSELIAMTTPIDGADYRTLYLTYDAAQLRKFRVGESAEIPIATITSSERTIALKKYGRGIRISYEALRRTRVDKIGFMIAQMAIQSEIDKVAAALDVLINGDGNSGTTPTTHNLTTLDSAAVAGTLTLKGWLAFKMKFAQPYVLIAALMQEAVALQLALLNTGSANIPLVAANLGGLGTGLTPINQFADGVRFGWTSEAPALKIVGTDRRFALEHVTEIGGEISELERFITNQTQVMTMTEVSGFAIMDPNATKVLDVNA